MRLTSTCDNVYSIELFAISLAIICIEVSGFLWVVWFPSPIKKHQHNITEILLKMELNTHP